MRGKRRRGVDGGRDGNKEEGKEEEMEKIGRNGRK